MARLLTALLVIAVTVCFVPQMGKPVYATSGDPAMVLGTYALKKDANTKDAQVLWYGNTNWYVIAYGADEQGLYSDGAATMLAAGDFGYGEYAPRGSTNEYSSSTIRTKLKNSESKFSSGESEAIQKWNDDLLWPLSADEAAAIPQEALAEWFFYDWWTRSPGLGSDKVAFVQGAGSGKVNRIGELVENVFMDYRPAFSMDLEKILLVSAAQGGKSSGPAGADALKVQSDLTNSGSEWKVTVKDNAHAGFTISKTTPTENGVTVEYTGAQAGTNEYISAIITDESGAIKYYGRIATVSAAADTVTINTADKLGENDHLYVFNEQCNGDKKTDYASELTEVTIPELISYTVTFKVKNGSWNDGKTADKKVTLSRYDNEDKALVLQSDDIPAVGNKPANGYKAGSWDTTPDTDTAISKDTTYTYTYAKKDDPTPTPTPTKVSGTLLAKITAKGSKSLVLTWNKINGAEGYDIFFVKCGNNTTPKLVKTIKGNKTFKWIKKSLKKKKAYKAVVKAYVMKNGKKSYVRTSPMVHAYTSGSTKNYTNAKSVTVNKTSVSLKKGNTFKIKAKVNKLKKGKKLMPAGHAPKLRYVSSNKKIATVSSSGKITAKSKGSCKVYVIAVNGARKAITVTVK